ncbi:MAG: acyltransferase [Polyangia bacterium]
MATAAPRPPTSADHVPALDGVRGIAILLVLAHNLNIGSTHGTLPARLIKDSLDAGWAGVQLFFVLSGFLITGILLDTRRSSNFFRAFYGRRTLRIFPLYYAVLFAWFVLAPLVFTLPSTMTAGSEHQIWLWTYLANWAAPYGRGVAAFPHFWSLSVEEQFYLVWPLFVYTLSPRRLFAACIGLSVVALASRIVLRDYLGVGAEEVYVFTICRMDALAMGAMVAIGIRDDGIRAWVARYQRPIRVALATLAVIGVVVTHDYARIQLRSQLYGYSILGIVFAWLVAVTVLPAYRVRPWHRPLSWAPLRALGTYSYGIYIFHMPLNIYVGIPIMNRIAPDGAGLILTGAYMIVMSLGTLFLAVVSFYLLEKPFLSLKKYFTPTQIDRVPL